MSAAAAARIRARLPTSSWPSPSSTGFDGAALARASRLVAKVDSAAVQDGFDLYLHGFVVADDGAWVVVQQGMNGDLRLARRYHWLSQGLASFVDAPHAAIEGEGRGEIVNLADRRAAASRACQLDLLRRGRTRPPSPARRRSSTAGRRHRPSSPSCPTWSCRRTTRSAPRT